LHWQRGEERLAVRFTARLASHDVISCCVTFPPRDPVDPVMHEVKKPRKRARLFIQSDD